ncbi:MAG: fatty acid oxidation complex subunit alpha FadJ, partial [Verrucomicrobiales bacterium]|nr:fatty acid oxidation complex subunit alpha FadJ [Verrucomicrobiales bacterium]
AYRVPLTSTDLVIEAAVENLEVKKKIFADLCARSRADTILATNTSALPITELARAEGITHPERIIGIHFFNPVHRMKLVEVVVTEMTDPAVVEATLRFIRRLGKSPVVVKDSPGFVVNRILMPYLIEAGRMFENGVDANEIDEAMLDFGMPMGPLRLLDEVGLDVAQHVAETMSGAFGDKFVVPAVLSRLVESGQLGRKSGAGFFDYNAKTRNVNPLALEYRSADSDSPMTREEIAERLAGLMADEAALVLDEGVAASADDIDFAMILGTGFAPFRGGPLTYRKAAESPG